MPILNGFEVREILAKDPETATIPFIFLTARTDQTDKLYGLKLEADDYITKPFDRDELVARIRSILRRRETGRQEGLAELETQMAKLRNEITRNLSHELLTPLSVIMATFELILLERFETLDEQEKFVQTALDYTHHLHVLVIDLILLSDLDQNKINNVRQPLDLQSAFFERIETTAQRWHEKNLDIHPVADPDIILNAPRTEFGQAIGHLIDNACKFNPKNGRINIHLAANGEGGCLLTIDDQGPGIPPNMHEKVFERYFQIDQSMTRLHAGLGVGLPIARAIARSVGGDVVILDSAAGCRVQLTIPPIEAKRVFLERHA